MIWKAKRHFQIGLMDSTLDLDFLEFKVYADAAYACNDYLISQISYSVLLCDFTNKSYVLEYSRKESKRVVRSIMAAKVCVFMDAFDAVAV